MNDMPDYQHMALVGPIKPKPRRRWRAPLIAAVAVVTLVAGGAIAGNLYLAHRVALGVSFASQNLGGKTESEVTSIVTAAASKATITVSADGHSVQATYADLGIKPDIAATVAAIMGTSRGPVNTLNILSKHEVPLVATVDHKAQDAFLTSKFISPENQIMPGSLSFDTASSTFVVGTTHAGVLLDPTSIAPAITQSLADPSVTVDAGLSLVPVAPDAAQQAATQANAYLALDLTVGNTDATTYTVPRADIAGWLTFTGDAATGKVTVGVNDALVTQQLPAELKQNLAQEQVNVKGVVMPNGETQLSAGAAGVNGVTVTNTTSAIKAIVAGLHAQTNVTTTVAAQVQPFSVTTTADYSKPNGDHWMKADLSTQTAYAYAGSTLIKTMPFVSGGPGWRTPTGTFTVQYQSRETTMKYKDPNGTVATCDGIPGPWLYCDDGGSEPGHSPKVKDSTYFTNTGVAFHAAPWNLANIAAGNANGGSHGCLNMTPADAAWVYTFVQPGSLVEVSGSAPSTPTR